MNRGDVVVSAAPGDYGKPRPSLVVQSDLFNATHASVGICPITSRLVEAPLFRVPVQPSSQNGLKMESQIMIDKIMAVKRERIGKRIGRLSASQMTQVSRALRLWLELDGP
ncbi:MAG: type II toxin-antitoxin system PemK/MazF family toxin [Acidobacteria bacterium]|nr:type II toxin-antitoxin system PemK/MazF family toxin [Acidobacteriota bacterium]